LKNRVDKGIIPTEAFRNVLILGSVWPEPNSSAAGVRMMQLISFFLSQSACITFASPAADSDFMYDLDSLGIKKKTVALNCDHFDVFVRDLQPTLVLFDRFMVEEQFGWRVVKECPSALRVLDTEDLHCLRSARQLAWQENRKWEERDLFSNLAKREIASIWRCDLSLIISSFEMELLQDIFTIDSSLLLYLPFLIEPLKEQERANWPTFEQREHFVFIGNFLHPPNWNAVNFLKQEIWPLIRKQLPKVELHVYGAYPRQKVKELSNTKEGFLCMGRAESAHAVISKAKVTVAPLRFGAGLKGKLVEAMQCGTPSVTTSIGAEAMHDGLPWSGAIADSAPEIARKAIALYLDPDKWKIAQNNGVEIMEQCYSKKRGEEMLWNRITEIHGTKEKHRQNNFIGQMLHHHRLASTKYMSLWITEKNRGLF
jgi:glycosyltransferase involved in cell wall biosynthesis